MDRYKITAQNSVFVLIDLQTNLASAMKKEVLENTERNTAAMIEACQKLDVPVLATEQYRKGLGLTLERIRHKLGDCYKPFEKIEFSCYANKEFLDSFIKLNRKYVMIAGIESHVCVLQTALDFLNNGYFVHIISDAVCSRYKSDWRNAMNYLSNAGAVISTTEIVVFQLLQTAGTLDFKAVSPLFKNKESYWSS
ncbi:MAG: isochorismatase family protein [Dehalococcoidia bacterium]|nr:isochorismatase family protein [Dehalococcoidia bacterium]